MRHGDLCRMLNVGGQVSANWLGGQFSIRWCCQRIIRTHKLGTRQKRAGYTCPPWAGLRLDRLLRSYPGTHGWTSLKGFELRVLWCTSCTQVLYEGEFSFCHPFGKWLCVAFYLTACTFFKKTWIPWWSLCAFLSLPMECGGETHTVGAITDLRNRGLRWWHLGVASKRGRRRVWASLVLLYRSNLWHEEMPFDWPLLSTWLSLGPRGCCGCGSLCPLERQTGNWWVK